MIDLNYSGYRERTERAKYAADTMRQYAERRHPNAAICAEGPTIRVSSPGRRAFVTALYMEYPGGFLPSGIGNSGGFEFGGVPVHFDNE